MPSRSASATAAATASATSAHGNGVLSAAAAVCVERRRLDDRRAVPEERAEIRDRPRETG